MAGLLGAMRRHRGAVGELGGAVDHFLRVSRSYWPGLFACYGMAGLPRTNNDPERAFGSHRSHERRTTGRKGRHPPWCCGARSAWWPGRSPATGR
jgi:hypothetical protein